MTRPSLLLCILGLGLCTALLSCEERSHPHPHEGEAHGHDHGDGHAQRPPTAEAERPDLSVTKYEDGLELFMEYPALVAGMPSALIAHFTDARNPDGFKVVTQGRVVATLRYADGREETFVADKPLRDGIFKPVVTPSRAGEATLHLRLEGPQLSGAVDAGAVRVHPDVSSAIKAAPEEKSGDQEISFLKEQQWKTQYATEEVRPRVLQGGVRANGELKPIAGQFAELAAPVAGRIPLSSPVPRLGAEVKKGDSLVQVVPTGTAEGQDLAGLEMEATRARAELGLAQRELARAEELFAAQAIPEKQLDAARVAKQVAQARVAGTERQLSQHRTAQGGGTSATSRSTFELRSPIDGVVSFSDVTPGAVVETGRTLVSVVNASRLWLEVKVYEADAPRVEQSPGAAFTVAGFEQEFTVGGQSGGLVAVGAVVDRATRTVPVLFELPNPGGLLKPGMFAKATVYTGQTIRGLAVPEAAIVDDDGKPTVFVLTGGESFVRRVIRPGIASGGYVQVLDGVTEGERVVSRGAYELKLASASGGIPEHGHAH